MIYAIGFDEIDDGLQWHHEPLKWSSDWKPREFRARYVLPARQHRDDLRNACLVSRSWRAALQGSLDSLLVIVSSTAATNAARAMERHATLAAAVRTIVVGAHVSYSWDAHAETLGRLFAACSQARTVIVAELVDVPLPTDCTRVVSGLTQVYDLVDTVRGSGALVSMSCAVGNVGREDSGRSVDFSNVVANFEAMSLARLRQAGAALQHLSLDVAVAMDGRQHVLQIAARRFLSTLAAQPGLALRTLRLKNLATIGVASTPTPHHDLGFVLPSADRLVLVDTTDGFDPSDEAAVPSFERSRLVTFVVTRNDKDCKDAIMKLEALAQVLDQGVEDIDIERIDVLVHPNVKIALDTGHAELAEARGYLVDVCEDWDVELTFGAYGPSLLAASWQI